MWKHDIIGVIKQFKKTQTSSCIASASSYSYFGTSKTTKGSTIDGSGSSSGSCNSNSNSTVLSPDTIDYFAPALHLFCATLLHTLMAMDDDELFGRKGWWLFTKIKDGYCISGCICVTRLLVAIPAISYYAFTISLTRFYLLSKVSITSLAQLMAPAIQAAVAEAVLDWRHHFPRHKT